jgi:cytochrome b involved in lipid metabolism
MAPNTPQVQRELSTYTRQEVAQHKQLDDCWIVVGGEVYNISSWLKRHPGGARILMHYAGEDATVSCSAVS